MNKAEKEQLIEKIINFMKFGPGAEWNRGYDTAIRDVLAAVKQLPETEPEKVVLKHDEQFVSDWIVNNPNALVFNGKFNWWHISSICGGELADLDVRFARWVNDERYSYENRQRFFRAILYGYTVEQPKKWVVKAHDCFYVGGMWNNLSNYVPVTEDRACVFTNKSDAEAIASLSTVQGSVEECE